MAGAAGVVLVLAATSCSPAMEEHGGPSVRSTPSATTTSGPRSDAGGATGRSDTAASPKSTQAGTSSAGRAKSDSSSNAAAAQGSAAAVLAELAVKGRSAKTGYSRDQFGPAWLDTDQNRCNTRVICTGEREAA